MWQKSNDKRKPLRDLGGGGTRGINSQRGELRRGSVARLVSNSSWRWLFLLLLLLAVISGWCPLGVFLVRTTEGLGWWVLRSFNFSRVESVVGRGWWTPFAANEFECVVPVVDVAPHALLRRAP